MISSQDPYNLIIFANAPFPNNVTLIDFVGQDMDILFWSVPLKLAMDNSEKMLCIYMVRE